MINYRKNFSNFFGWRTNRRFIVFESDDWGSIRTRSSKDYDAMLRKGLEIEKSNYTKNDSLESNRDLENLFEILLSHKDSKGRSAVFTPMCIVANPDFIKIRESKFTKYYYECFTETCKNYPNHDRVPSLWKEGIKNNIFVPGLHGREHLSVSRWMKLLAGHNEGVKLAFEHGSFGASAYKGKPIPEYLGAFHPDRSSDIPKLQEILEEAAKLFKNICGYDPTHFIAPNREGPIELDDTLSKLGVKYLTNSKLRHYPKGDEKYGNQINWLGKKNQFDQITITRNCGFEPTGRTNYDWVGSCLKDIEIAFKWKKPAVISSHRVNYIGHIHPENAAQGLKSLDDLLTRITKLYPDVEFMTSTELGEIIRASKK